MTERQELWCHDCRNYVQFDIDVSMNGNHIITCPKCGHEHMRVVTNGVITETRWGSNNNTNAGAYTLLQTYMTTGITASNTSTFNTYQTVSPNGCAFTYGSWMNSGTGTGFC